MNQLFYNIAGGIVHQIRREKRTTISEVIVRGKRNIKQNRNWFYFKFFVESSSFISQQFKCKIQFVICLVLPECLSVKICCISPSDSEANRDGADAESPFPLFFFFPASFKNSSPREKVGKLSSFWDWWTESLLVSIIATKHIIFPGANNGRSREKKFLAKRFAHAITVHYRDFEHAYVY